MPQGRSNRGSGTGPPSDPQPYATFVVELLLAEDGGVRRTRVTHVQSGTGEQWRSWDGERLLGFIAGHAAVPDTG